MNRRTLVLGTATVAIGAFAGASWLATRPAPVPGADNPDSSGTTSSTLPFDPAILIRANSPVIGPADAPVTIVEFFDPSCEACRAFHPILQQIRAEFPTEVRIVMRYTVFHEGSDEAVRILEAARMQDLFEPVLDALLARQPEWAPHDAPRPDLAWQIAGEAGLDVEKGMTYRLFPGTVAILNRDAADVIAAGIQQTPTFFVNGKALPDFGPEQLVEMVRAEVAAL